MLLCTRGKFIFKRSALHPNDFLVGFTGRADSSGKRLSRWDSKQQSRNGERNSAQLQLP